MICEDSLKCSSREGIQTSDLNQRPSNEIFNHPTYPTLCLPYLPDAASFVGWFGSVDRPGGHIEGGGSGDRDEVL